MRDKLQQIVRNLCRIVASDSGTHSRKNYAAYIDLAVNPIQDLSVDIAGRASHDIVDQGLTALRNMEHRGASGSEPDSGDGAGILVQVPDAFCRIVYGL